MEGQASTLILSLEPLAMQSRGLTAISISISGFDTGLTPYHYYALDWTPVRRSARACSSSSSTASGEMDLMHSSRCSLVP